MKRIVTSSQPDSIITWIDLVTNSVAVSQETEIQLAYYYCIKAEIAYNRLYSNKLKEKISSNHFKSKAPALFQMISEN